jgi:hypothetical protein
MDDENALAIKCPQCGRKPGVWCGPVLDDTFNPYSDCSWIIPWMHQKRYDASA